MKIEIRNCNNIDYGTIEVRENALNIKYGINGTGKSTVVRALKYHCAPESGSLAGLTPYKHLDSPEGHEPSVVIDFHPHNVCVFDEEYVSTYVFREDELVKGSFEIFVRTADYEEQIKKIEEIVRSVSGVFRDDADLASLIADFEELVKGFGNAKSGYAANGAIAKGIGKGNKVDNIPEGLEVYEPYLKSQDNLGWLEWCLDGMRYRTIGDGCPFCAKPMADVGERLDKLDSTYDTKELKNFNKMFEVFRRLEKYFAAVTREKVWEILKNADEISASQKDYLIEIRKEAEGLESLLKGLRDLSFVTLKDETDIVARMRDLQIDLDLYPHFKSESLESKAGVLNESLKKVLEAASSLKEAVGRQRSFINRIVRQSHVPINRFLETAGYPYRVALEEQADKSYKLMLHPADLQKVIVSNAKGRLSYGERNALSLVLFVFSALRTNADLIVLDDPISSFDGSKKFALVDLLFLEHQTASLRGRTVVMLTHDFAPVIDVMKTLYGKWPSEIKPEAAFLSNQGGMLSELAIEPDDIRCSIQLMNELIRVKGPTLIRLIYLRRKLEMEGDVSSLIYHLISSLLHKRQTPTLGRSKDAPVMTEDDIGCATVEVQRFIPGFSYENEYAAIMDKAALASMYGRATSYEKLQIVRLMYETSEMKTDAIVKKFCNETYHIENDFLFQLDPRKFDTVPAFVIERLDSLVESGLHED